MPETSAARTRPIVAETPEEILARIDATGERLVVRTDGAATIWRRWGEGGDTLVLLHGGYGSWRHWVRNVEALSRTRTVLVADMPGLGESDDVPKPVTVEAVAQRTTQSLHALLPGGAGFDLAGFSFGSTVSGLVHEEIADRVRSLTLVGPGALGLERVMVDLVRWRAELPDAERREVNRINLSRLMIADPAKIDDLAIHIQDENTRQARVPSRKIVPPATLAEALKRRPPRRINGIWGAKDAVMAGDLASREAYIASFGPDAAFRAIAGAGHWVAYEAADEFNPLLDTLLSR